MKKNYILVLAGLAIAFSSCNQANLKRDAVWVPVYKDKTEARVILNLPAQQVRSGGKIYAYGNYIFQLEQNQGIHVYRLDDKKPVPVKFIQVYGAQEIAIKDNLIYTNNFKDIVVLNASNPQEVAVESRIPGAFDMNTFELLPPSKGYFQCIDTTKGMLIGWEKQDNVEAACIY
ncbi:MAG: hypothetical protein BGO31_05140 [Bacteroidetes bacterium 43-16]|nr:MAG: hypothetical protein BGO31_05140 [Bacteroidetes bacterium 43-16]